MIPDKKRLTGWLQAAASVVVLAGLILPQIVQAAEKTQSAGATKQPNILIILADDLGYSDLGAFGSQIATPNLDKLALSGVRLAHFYATPVCSSTRAELLSGTDSHIAGLGNMAEELAPNQIGHPGYEGYLNFRVASLAQVMKDNGYHTYMTGKWHLGMTPETSPSARGFENTYALLQGGGSHFDMRGMGPEDPISEYRENGKQVTVPSDFYSSDFYTTQMISYIKSHQDDGKPFFAYLAFTATHMPLQAPDASIEKYAGKYEDGWEALRLRRLEKMKKLGLIPQNVVPHPFSPAQHAWDKLSPDQKKIEAKKMQVFAAMVDRMDWDVGRLIQYLKASGQFDNTVIIFMSDNGAEGHDLKAFDAKQPAWVAANYDNSYANMGREHSFIAYGPYWAEATTAPSRLYKAFTSEGGIHVPAFIYYKGFANPGSINATFATVMDIAPTILDITNIKKPEGNYDGHAVAPMTGLSMLPLLQGRATEVHASPVKAGWELFGKRAIRWGEWKIIWLPKPFGPDHWQLYNIVKDPAEMNDLAAKYPDQLKKMEEMWSQYVKANGVILPNVVDGY